MKRDLCSLGIFLFLVFFSASVFSEEGSPPCPEHPQVEAPSAPSAPADSGPSSAPSSPPVSTVPLGSGGDTKDQLGVTLNPDQQGGGGKSGMGTLGVGSGGGGDKKTFGPSDFMTLMRAYLDNARMEIKAKEKELRKNATLREMERSVGLKSKQRLAEEAFDGLIKAHERLGKVEGKVKELEKELEKEKIKLESERKVFGHSYYQKDVDKVQRRLDEVLPEYNAASAQLNGASENYQETHDILNQAREDMTKMEQESHDTEGASIPNR